jgi:alpha-mannosidase
MLSSSPLLQLSPARVQANLNRIGKLIYKNPQPLAVRAGAWGPKYLTLAEAKRKPLRPVQTGETWGKLFDQRWFHVRLPARVGKNFYFHWNDSAEATAYLDGTPYYGFDVAHRHAPVPAGAKEFWIEATCVQSAIWHPAATGLSSMGSVFSGAGLVERDELAWDVYHDLLVLFGLLIEERRDQFAAEHVQPKRFGHEPAITNVSVLYRRLSRLLDGAMDAYEQDGLPAARKALKAIYRQLPADAVHARCILTGHAHIDLVWLWPERVGEQKAVHTFSTVNRLMDRYPELRFAYSQPASYRAVERKSPTLFREVRKRMRQGRWEATGALEVESDTLLACGEALARSFLLGQEEFKRLRGTPAEVLWIPDVFGYSACLPQLMRQTGVESFFTTKLTWSSVNSFPYSSFIWRGNDGSEVVTHVTQEVGYNGQVDFREIRLGERAHRQSDVHPEYLAPTGFGDGGGGPTEEMCERARRLRDLAGMPPVAWGRVEDFFARLRSIRGRLPVYQGELYLEYHRGTYTSHGDLKANFRALERSMQLWEAAHAVTGRGPVDIDVWRRLVFAQFHDYIPGSSIPDVYVEARRELPALAKKADRAAQDALEAGRNGSICLFNPLPLPRTSLVWNSQRRKFYLLPLPPLAGVDLVSCEPLETPPVTVGPTRLSNGRVQARFDRSGSIRSLEIDGRPVEWTGPGASLVTYPDLPHAFEPWDIDRHTLSLGRPVTGPAEVRVESSDPARAVLAFRRAIGTASAVITRYILETGSSVLRLEYEIDWRDTHTLLKVHFPTAYRGRWARYGSPFGSIQRPQQAGPTEAEAMWEVPGSRYAAVSDEGERNGLFVVTEAKYGFSCRDGILTVSLLRSPFNTGNEDHRKAARPPGLSRLQGESEYIDIGRHQIRLAIGSHDAEAPLGEQPAALAETLFTPPLPYRGRPVQTGYLGLEGDHSLLPCWTKPVGKNAYVIRFHEILGRRGTVRLLLAAGWRATRVDLLEKAIGAVGAGRRLAFKPYEIISVRIERS